MVADARDLRARGDAEARLDHAAQHHPEPERTCGDCDAQRLADPARLRQLDVDSVCPLGAPGDVRGDVAVLVDVDRHRRAPLQLGAVRVTGGERLLAVLDLHLREELDGLVERPVLVDVDLEGERGRSADGAHAVEVEAVAAAELQLQPLESAPLGGLGAARHVVGVAEPHGPRRGRAVAAQAEELPDRKAHELALEVVERRLDGRARRLLARRQRLADLLERPRIAAELDALQPGERRLRRLVVALDRGRLAEPGQAVVPDLDLHDLGLVLRLARDHEGLRQPERRDLRLELHGASLVK